MAKVSFKPDLAFEAEIRKQPQFRIAMLEAATIAKGFGNAFAREFHAPWMPRRGHQVVEVQQHGGNTYLVNTDWAGVFEEFGGRRNPPHATLRRAARAAGLELRETSGPH
jgi:ATP-dependent phosphoenolpyruvate carboxykinase